LLYVLVAEFNLRPYVFHIDNGWDMPFATRNMKRLCDCLYVPLHHIELDTALVYDIQRAFLLSGVPDCDVASDHIIRAVYYDLCDELSCRYAVIGTNYRTETHGVRAWSQGHADWTYIQQIHRRFGTRPTAIPHYSVWRLLWHRLTRRPRMIPLLNYLDYRRATALETLQTFCGYESYRGKHGENRFTRWFQGMYLPERFGYDKRKCHLSNLVCAGELTRDEALRQLQVDPYDPDHMMEDTAEVGIRLNISHHEFVKLLEQPIKTYNDYPHSRLLTALIRLRGVVR
jgi:hypothetical protein